MDITGFFITGGRPDLTELCLRRDIEMGVMDYCDEFYLVCDDPSNEHREHVTSLYDFDKVFQSKEQTWCSRFYTMNEAYKEADADAYFHLEDDFWFDNTEAFDIALEGVKQLDFVRFEFLEYRHHNFTKLIVNDRVGVLHSGMRYEFNFNPHLRTTKYPFDEFFNEAQVPRSKEGRWSEIWRKNDEWRSGVVLGNSVRHLGIYSTDGTFREDYLTRFTGNRNESPPFEPIKEFDKITDNDEYRQLFRSYVDANQG